MMGFSLLVSHNIGTSKLLISLSLMVDNTDRDFIQAIDRLFRTHDIGLVQPGLPGGAFGA